MNALYHERTGQGKAKAFPVYLDIYFFPYTLRKHAYSNALKILPPKNENFQMKKFW